MKKIATTMSFIGTLLFCFLNKGLGQNNPYSRIIEQTKPSLSQRIVDTILQKKNLLFVRERDITKQRNLLYQPDVEGKPKTILLETTKPYSLPLVGR